MPSSLTSLRFAATRMRMGSCWSNTDAAVVDSNPDA